MAKGVTLHGYRFSVYTRIARLALELKGVAHLHAEVNPFDADGRAALLARCPFGRVPVLEHGGFRLYETTAITAYVDRAFDGPALMPEAPRAAARVAQVIAVADAYGYVPLVRQVFSHRVFRPAEGHQGSEEVVAEGLRVAPRVLGALEEIAAEGLLLSGAWTRADCHLAPMVDYFCRAPEGAALIARFPALAAWWDRVRETASLRASDPGLPGAGGAA